MDDSSSASSRSNGPALSPETMKRAYRDMLLVRRFEEKAGQLYGMGLIGGFCHLYIGQEAVVVGIGLNMKQGDKSITSYRDHGQMLVAGMTPRGVMAELTGRSGGYSHGKGGSMHMFSREKEFYGGHGIVGAQVALGTGLAILFGTGFAAILRVGLALLATTLLSVVGLTLAGGFLLLWVCWKMYRELRGGEHHEDVEAAPPRLGPAVLKIVVADLSMSLDNVLAVAGAAVGHPWILVSGLVLSVLLMGLAASVIANLLARYRWIAWIGLLVVLVVAIELIIRGGGEVWHHVLPA